MLKELTEERQKELVSLVLNGKLGQTSIQNLELLLDSNLGPWPDLGERIQFEIQKRHMNAAIKWQK